MKFRKISNINLSYAKQGQIFFTLANYTDQPPNVKNRIDALLSEAARGSPAYEKALRAWLLRGDDFDAVVQRYYVRGGTLTEMRKRIYEEW